jgi:YVTN family beta-propeller protein
MRRRVFLSTFGLAAAATLLLCWPLPAIAAPDLYVSHTFPPSVSVIDTATNSVRTTVSLSAFGSPGPLAADPRGGRVYVAVGFRVLIIRAATNTVADGTIDLSAGFPGGSVSLALALSPDGSRLYAARGDSVLFVIDTETNAVLFTIHVGPDPRGVAVHPTGSRVYTANFDFPGSLAGTGGSVSVVDAASRAVIASPFAGPFPSAIAVHPDGSRVYVANGSSSNTFTVINSATNVAIGSFPFTPPAQGFGGSSITVNPAGTRLYVAFSAVTGGDSKVAVIDTGTNAVLTTISIPRNPTALAVHPDGTRLYAASIGPAAEDFTPDGVVSVIDTNTNSVVSSVTVGKFPQAAAILSTPGATAIPVSNAPMFGLLVVLLVGVALYDLRRRQLDIA